jgi:branched-subunit amino acid ABC-type transport system permease component
MDLFLQLLLNSIVAGSMYAMVAMSFNLIYGVSRSFNLAHGVLGTIAAYIVFFLSASNHVSVFWSIPAGLLAAALTGLLMEKAVFHPLRIRKSSNYVLLIASLGLTIAIEAFVAMLFTSHFKTILELLPHNYTIHLASGSVTEVQAVIIGSAVFIFIFFWFLLSYTRFGKAIRAIADDEEVAKIVGIETDRIIAIVFIIGSLVMGWAGILAGFDTGLEPRMGFLLLLDGAIAAIVGGIGNVYGAFLGAFLLGFGENFGVWYFSGQWKYAIAFLVLIVFLLFRPQGILGKK